MARVLRCAAQCEKSARSAAVEKIRPAAYTLAPCWQRSPRCASKTWLWSRNSTGSWRPGFVAVTGETGAGKSVILGALKLLLGERAEKSLIRTGADACTVEACLRRARLRRARRANSKSTAWKAAWTAQLIVKRTFTQAGGNRQFVNGSPTTLAVLKQLGDLLVDLHGPHDHQSLLSAERQLDLLDAFSRAEATRQRIRGTLEPAGPVARGTRQPRLQRGRARTRTRTAAPSGHAKSRPPTCARTRRTNSRPAIRCAANSRRLIELATGVAQELTESEPSILSGSPKRPGCCANWKKSTPPPRR